MPKLLISFLIVIFSCSGLIGQIQYEKPDPKASAISKSMNRALSKNPKAELPRLVAYLIEDAKDDYHKVKRLHDWVALNIAYDTKAFFSGRYPSQDYDQVLRRRNSVCAGNANLLKEMFDLAGLPNEIIEGYSRGYGFEVFGSENFEKGIQHNWNAVKVEGEWCLVDVTWDAGFVEGKTFVKKYTDVYLFPQGNRMIYSHFPDDPKWQLLRNPLSVNQFKELPPVQKNFYRYNIEFTSPIKKVNKVDFSHEFELITPPNTAISATLIDSRGQEYENQTLCQKLEGKWNIKTFFPKKDKWLLRLFVKELGEDKYHSFAEVGFQNRKAATMSFPKKYRQFDEYNCQLLSPIKGELESKEQEHFKVIMPGIKKAAISDGENWYDMKETQAGIFELDLKIPKTKEILLFVKKDPKQPKYNALLNWKVKR